MLVTDRTQSKNVGNELMIFCPPQSTNSLFLSTFARVHRIHRIHLFLTRSRSRVCLGIDKESTWSVVILCVNEFFGVVRLVGLLSIGIPSDECVHPIRKRWLTIREAAYNSMLEMVEVWKWLSSASCPVLLRSLESSLAARQKLQRILVLRPLIIFVRSAFSMTISQAMET
jgi:hypothetical protein